MHDDAILCFRSERYLMGYQRQSQVPTTTCKQIHFSHDAQPKRSCQTFLRC